MTSFPTPSVSGSGTTSGGPAVPPHYAALGVVPSIGQAELARHFKQLSLELHPDRVAYRSDPADEPDVRARFQSVTEAYAVLSDPQRRAAYDTQYGVNFQSRVARMRDVINSGVIESSTADAIEVAEAADWKRHRVERVGCTGTHCDSSGSIESSADDDDDVYVPERVPTALSPLGPHDSGTRDWQSAPSASGTALARVFSLLPRGPTSHATLRQVGLVPLPEEARVSQDDASRLESYYGITMRGNVLTRARAPGVPFPARIRIANGFAVEHAEDVAAAACRTQKGAAGTPAPRAVCTFMQNGESPDTVDDGSTLADEQVLEITLSYATEVFDLVGDTSRLRDAAVRQALVPGDAINPAITVLNPDATVVAVNGESVDSAGELRDRLAALVSVGSDSVAATTLENDDNASERRGLRRPQRIWLALAALAATL